ncbi:GtrA family protein [Undibacterium arcticum]
MRLAQLLRLVRFGIVGLASAAVHYLVVVGLVELTYMHPLVANIIGFATSVWVSYFGHRHWTFGEHTTTSTSTSMMRFSGDRRTRFFCVNELLFLSAVAFPDPALLCVVNHRRRDRCGNDLYPESSVGFPRATSVSSACTEMTATPALTPIALCADDYGQNQAIDAAVDSLLDGGDG